MPFSSVLGASSVIKPGVCTSSTRPTVPYTGQLIYETDTGMVAAWNGSAWVYTHSSGLVLISSTTIGSAVSSVTVNGAFSADYDNYIVNIIGGAASATPIYLNLTLGATTTGYYSSEIYGGYGSNTLSLFSRTNHTAFIGGGVSTDNIALSYRLFGPNLAKTTHFMTEAPLARTAGNNWSYAIGYLNDTTQYTAFTITTVSGTLTGGTIRVYGYRN
jgi:hypothetical protein